MDGISIKVNFGFYLLNKTTVFMTSQIIFSIANKNQQKNSLTNHPSMI